MSHSRSGAADRRPGTVPSDAMKPVFALLAAAALAAGPARADAPVPVALLSVATEAGTLDVARPDTQRPAVALKPLPYAQEFVLGLKGPAQKHALEENERVAAENERAVEIALAEDRETRNRREKDARHALGQSELGKAVLRAPSMFAGAVTNGLGLAVLHADAEGFVAAAPEDARFVRLLFGEPAFRPKPEVVPGISNEPIRVALPVTLKIESTAGETLSLETFEQTATAPNSDSLIGPARAKFFESLVKSAVESAVARIANPAVQSAPKESRKP